MSGYMSSGVEHGDVFWWKQLEGGPSFIKVLVAGGFVDKEKVKSMQVKEQRAELIKQLSDYTLTPQKNYDDNKDNDVMGKGAILVCLLNAFPELFDKNKKLLAHGDLSDTLRSKILDVYARQMSEKWLKEKSDWDLVTMCVDLARSGMSSLVLELCVCVLFNFYYQLNISFS